MNTTEIRARMKQAAALKGMNLIEASIAAGLGKNFPYAMENPGLRQLEAFADATDCVLEWLVGGPGMIAGELPVIEDAAPRAAEIPLMQKTSTAVNDIVVAWANWDREAMVDFLATLQRLGLYDKTMFFELIGGLFVYRYVGGYFVNSLGDYIVKAPGRVLGEIDRDKRFAEWSTGQYRECLRRERPIRQVCDVVSYYQNRARRFVFDRVLLPHGDSVIMVLDALPPPELEGLGVDLTNTSPSSSAATPPAPQPERSLAAAPFRLAAVQ